MTVAGKLQIRIDCQATQVRQVSIHSSRPVGITGIFLGKTPEQLLSQVPMIFSLCTTAQSYAAYLACTEALGMQPGQQENTARDILLNIETLREHCWRLVLDWPKLIRTNPDKTALMPFLTFTKRGQSALFADSAFQLNSRLQIRANALADLVTDISTAVNTGLFAGQLDEFLAIKSETELLHWLQNHHSLIGQCLVYIITNQYQAAAANALELLPDLERQSLIKQLLAENHQDFCSKPTWCGQCYETSAFNRQQHYELMVAITGRYKNGLLPRVLACIYEVAAMPGQLNQLLKLLDVDQQACPPPPPPLPAKQGLAQLQAARGLLVHGLSLQDGRVSDYAIIAPTEWNFHPQGLLVHSLQNLTASNSQQLEELAHCVVHAIDPCVGYDLQINTDSCAESAALAKP